MKKDSLIYVAGHRGLVGSAILRHLKMDGYANLLTRTSAELDLTRQADTEAFFVHHRPEYVFLAAARVGGIWANATHPADFIGVNLAIQGNILSAARRFGVKRLLFLGSSCIYPKFAPQPMTEDHLMTGELEPTNSAYAVAKIAGIEMCRACNRQYGTRFLPVMPTNLYGPGDNFDLMHSHVLPAMIRKFHLARLATEENWDAIAADERRFGTIPEDLKRALDIPLDGTSTTGHPPSVILWGTGSPRREFLHVDDLSAACVFLMTHPEPERASPYEHFLINIGTGEDVTIRDLARMVAEVVGFDGEVVWDDTKPDGTPRKLLDVSRIARLGWRASIELRRGVEMVYGWYQTPGH